MSHILVRQVCNLHPRTFAHEPSYPQRSARYEEIEIDGIKVDYYDAKNRVIHEVKKSNKVEVAHEWQLKYYLYVFEQNGINGCTGILEYPTLRQTTEIILSEVDQKIIQEIRQDINEIIHSDTCPPRIKKQICKNCSYYEFCYTEEADEV